MILRHKIIFTLILFAGFIFRFWQLDQYPPSLNWDEISHGYNAYSLLKTGKDQWDTSWPIFNFRAYGDYPTTVNMYLTIPFISIFGINPITTRLPTAILGYLLIPISFFLSKMLLKNTKSSLFVALLVAISPWTLFTSRQVLQSTVSLFFLLLGISLSLLSLQKNKSPYFLIPGVFFWMFSSFAYHNTKIVAPLLLIFFLFHYRQSLLKIFYRNTKLLYTTLLTILLLIIPLSMNILNPDSRARSNWVFILNDAAINVINTQRGEYSNPVVGKLLSNKVTYFIPAFLKNYLNFLNPYNLFFTGSSQHQYNIPNQGLIFPILMPFFYLGFFYSILRFKKQKLHRFLLIWWLIGLLPAALTSGDLPILRAMTILPLPFIFIAYGFQLFIKKLKLFKFESILFYLISLLTIFQFFHYWTIFTSSYNHSYSQSWQYGYFQAIDFIKTQYPNYDQIIITKKYGEPHEFVLYYWPWDPAKYQNDPDKIWDYHANWYWVDAFDKFKFFNDWEIKDKTLYLDKKTLLVTSGANFNTQGARILHTIHFLDNTIAFQIISYEP